MAQHFYAWCLTTLLIALELFQTVLVRISEIYYWKFKTFTKNALTQWVLELKKYSFYGSDFVRNWLVPLLVPGRFQFKFEKRSPNRGPRNLHKECAPPNGWRDKQTHTLKWQEIFKIIKNKQKRANFPLFRFFDSIHGPVCLSVCLSACPSFPVSFRVVTQRCS